MDDIQSEIDQMVGTETKTTAPAKEQTSFILRWFAAWKERREIRKLPRGQRFIRAGFKAVTLGQMRERFAIDAINARRWDKEIAACLANRKINPDEIHITAVSGYPTQGKFFLKWIYKGSGCDGIESLNIPITKERAEAVVKIVALAEYIQDRIPDRVLHDIKRAKEMGLKACEIYVAFPAIEMVPEQDPIVIFPWEGKVGEPNTVYLELGYWE